MTWSRAMGWSLGLTQMVNDPNQDVSRLVPGSDSRNATQQQRFLSAIAVQLPLSKRTRAEQETQTFCRVSGCAMGWSLGLTQMVNDPNQDVSRLVPGSDSRNATQQQRFLSAIASEQENKG